MTRLRVREGDDERIVSLPNDRVVLGRQPGCEIVLSDPGISREHAELTRSGSTWWIADLGSRNGTFLNDAPIDRERLRIGDVARLGPDVIVELIDDGDDRQSARRASPRGRGNDERPRRATQRNDDDFDAESSSARAARASAVSVPWWQRLDWTLIPRASGAHRVALRSAVTTVGRDPAAGLSLADETVSRMHARVDRLGTKLQV